MTGLSVTLPVTLARRVREVSIERLQYRCGVLALLASVLAAALGLTGALVRSDNDALVDAGATAAVTNQLRDPLARVLTYDYGDMNSTRKAAKDLFAGPAVTQYNRLFGSIRAEAQQQRLIVTTLVRRLGVVRLHDDQAELLAFVDQQILSGNTQQRSGTAQLRLNAERIDGRWRVTGISVL